MIAFVGFVKKLCERADEKDMFGLRRALLACALTAVAVAGVVPTVAPEPVAEAADAPWTIPTSPPRCTTTQANNGDVAGCVLMAGAELPDARGWPRAPFPEPENPTVVAWVDLGVGSNDTTVAKVQEALNKAGATLVADGAFGQQTLAAVKAYQYANTLPVTGVVDQTMATKLGVQRTTGGTFPPKGWTWLGWGYNGSPALAAFEQQLVGNAKPIGAMRVGQLRSFKDALPLFEGFYAEIQRKGYVINDGGTWVFRCTASTRKDCAGQTRYSLSNHAFGLASDINTVKNPMVRYYALDLVTACSTPMKTDMPRWVVQTAEKWGLYWGGYAWSSGCQTPTQWRSSVVRDPMHFEFNGTPAQAQAILRRNLGSGKCIDVVNEAGVQVNWCLMAGEVPPAGTRVAITTAPPSGATAALVNIVTTNVQAPGWLAAEDCAARPAGPRPWSTGNVRTGRTTSATAVVPLDSKGRFCIYQSSAFHLVVDVQGYFAPSAAAPTGNLFTPVTPIRTVDTRTSTSCTPEGVCFAPAPVTGLTEVMSNAPTAAVPVATMANITVVGPAGPGYTVAGACDVLAPGAQRYSNVNFTHLDPATANMAVVPTRSTELGAQFCEFTTRDSHQVIDVTGFFAPPSPGALGYTALTPSRLVDTRRCWTDPVTKLERCAMSNAAGSVLRIAAPTGASAVLVNLIAVNSTTPGELTPAACSAFTANKPVAPAVQAVVGGAVANLAAVPVDPDGTFCVKVSTQMHVVVDLVGTFGLTADLRYVTVTPSRLLDTRPGT
ncbi:MAG: hypothetical protein RL238_2017 [Actinomycetota bacterium]